MRLRSYAMHVYTYLDGADGTAALRDLVRVCDTLGMPEVPPDGTQGVRTPGPRARRSFGGLTDRGIYQAIEYTTARLTAFLVCLVPAGGDRTWRELDTEWREAVGPAESPARVGRVRLYYALYEGSGGVGRLADLAREALPVPADAEGCTTLFAGCHLWEVDTGEDHRRDRTFILLAPASQEHRSDDWVWPDGTYRLPPLPGYLWELAKIRHEARRFEERRSLLSAQELTARAARFEVAERFGAQPGETRDHELRMLRRYTALASAGAAALRIMQRTVQAAAGNALTLLESAGRPVGDGGPLAADRAYLDWLLVELADEADTADDAVRYAEPLAGLASAAAEERLAELRQRGQVLTLLQTATIAAIGLVLAAIQAIDYRWRGYASVQTPFVVWVLFVGLFLPLVAATPPSGRHARRWRGWVLVSGAGFAASTGCLVVAWVIRWRTGAPAEASAFVVTAVGGVIVALATFAAWLLSERKRGRERR